MYKEAIALYERYTHLEPYDPRGFHELAILYESVEDFVKAEAAYRKVLDLKPDAIGYVNLNELDDSSFGMKFAASEPQRLKTSSMANFYLGRMHLRSGHYAVALRLLQTAAQIDKEWDEPYIAMAQVYRKQSRFAAALRAADQALELDEEDGEAHYERACALARLGRTREAMAALEKGVALFPLRSNGWIKKTI